MTGRNEISEIIRERKLSQRDVSVMSNISYQEINMFLKGKRNITIHKTLILDNVLGLPRGTIAEKQLRDEIEQEQNKMDNENKRKVLIDRIKECGGFWSYDSSPYGLNDDSVIEEALIHLPFEEINLLESCWSRSKIKKVWKEKLLVQGKRLNILNFLLALKIFKIKKPQQYIAKWV